MIGARSGFPLRVLALSVFVAAAALIFLYLFSIAGGVSVGDRLRLTAVVPTAVQLSPNADVTRAGVRMGRVEKISGRGATAVLLLALDPDQPVYRNARVQVRAKTLVGENYVELDPGSPSQPRLEDGAELRLARARPTTQLDDVLAEMSPARQRRVGRIFRGLGPGLADSEDVGAALTGLADLMEGGKALSAPLAAERQTLRVLVRDLGVTFRALGERGAAIRLLVRAGRTTAEAIAREDRAVRAALRELAPTLRQTQRTTGRLAAVGTRAVPVMDDLTASLERLEPLMRELPGAVQPTLGALRELEGSAAPARRLLTALRRVSGPGAAAVGPLDDVARELRPALSYLARYNADIGAFFGGLGQAATSSDATSSLARVQPVLSPAALPLLGEADRRAVDTLLGLGIGRVVNPRGQNNQPEPGTLATPKAFSGPYPRLTADPAGR